MSALLDELRLMGCDIDGAMGRFLNKEDFYARCYKKFLDDKSFAALGEALKAKNTDEAFHHSHTLKGVCANMGLTPLFDTVVKIVEPLRAGNYSDELLTYYDQLMTDFQKYKALGKKI